MRITKFATVGVALSAALLLSSCSGTAATGGDATPTTVSTTSGEGKTLTVWTMQDDYNDETLAAINAKFTEETGAKVDIQTQQWDGITTKVSTALATSTPPDVIGFGNTQIASFATSGGLLDLSAYRDDLAQGQTWIEGLEAPATVDGSLYAVPGFAGTRAVIYNKKMWAEAGVTAIPTTQDELTAALDKVAAKNTAADFSALYLPGQQWQVGVQFVWDAGAKLATQNGDTWTGDLSSKAGIAGLTAWKDFQNTYSADSSRTLDTVTPPLAQVFADGKASAIVAHAGFIAQIEQANPAITDADLGTFPIPGASGGTQPVLIGGSDWGIAAKSVNPELALQWTKIAASPEIQNDYVFGSAGWIPNSTEGIEAARPSLTDLQTGYFDAALNSTATPAAAKWADLEGNLAVNDLFSSIASGSKSVEDAAKAFDAQVDKVLNK